MRKLYNIKIISKLINKLFPNLFFNFFHKKKARLLKLSSPIYILSFDIDYSEDVLLIPKILKTLKKYSIISSFACIGKLIEKYPQIHKEIITQGHEILNHTYTHPNNKELNPNNFFYNLSLKEIKKEIKKCHIICKKILNYEPIGFRTPHFGKQHNYLVYKILSELNYKYSSSTIDYMLQNYGIPFKTDTGILEISLSCSYNFPFTLFDSYNTRVGAKALFKNDNEFIKEFENTIIVLKNTKSFITHYFDPRDIIQNNKLENMCGILQDNKIKTLSYKQIYGEYSG